MTKSGLIAIVIGLLLGSQVNAGAFSIIRDGGGRLKGPLESKVVGSGLSNVLLADGTGRELQRYMINSEFRTGYEDLYASEALRIVLGWNKFVMEHGTAGSGDNPDEELDTASQEGHESDGLRQDGVLPRLNEDHSECLSDIVKQGVIEGLDREDKPWPECGDEPKSPPPVPEPSTIFLLASGLIGLATYRLKRNG